MSLRVWLPLNGDINNQGLDSADVSVTSAQGSIVDGGKTGKCFKTTTTGDISLNNSSKIINTGDMSFGGWFKLNKAEIQTALEVKTYTSSATAATGSLIGNSNYGGFGLIWKSNNMYSSSKVLSSIDISASIRTSTTSKGTSSFAIDFDVWTHIFVTFNKVTNVLSLYKNGVLYSNTTLAEFSDCVDRNICINYKGIAGGNGPSASIPFYINDIRLYDHALSAKEVKELSKGLILHYKLDSNSIQTLNNCYNYPTFNKSSSNGGWNHWGDSGHKGSYGQNTDTQYIFRKGQTYSHWVQNAEGATKNYLLYQSPAFDGGYRSLQCILKESNSLPINESIVYPVWNAPVGTHTSTWDSIKDLGNGFYLCKCEGFQQDGSNDLVGLYIKPPYKVYVSECYLENNKTVCSDIFYQSNIVYDCSGYNHHGTPAGDLTVSSNSARNSLSTVFNGIDSKIQSYPQPSVQTISVWLKSSWDSINSGYKIPIHDYGSKLAIGFANNNRLISYVGSSAGGAGSCVLTTNKYIANQWNHIVVVKTGDTTRNVYINGELATNTDNNWWGGNLNKLNIGCRYSGSYKDYFDGQISDFRAYATALSAEDVKELYQTSASIDKSGNVFAYEFKED